MDYLNFNQACQRPDGSIYGIEDGKQCRKGSPITLDAKTVNLAYKRAREKGARSKDLKAITDRVKKSFPDSFSTPDSKIALINELNSFKPKTLSSRLKDVKEKTLAKGKQLRESLTTKIRSRVKLTKEREEAAKGAKEWGLTKDQELEIFRKAMEKFPLRDKTRASVRASKKAFAEAIKNYKKYSEEAKRKSDQELREVLGQIKEKGINPSAIANAREKVSKKFTNLNTKEAREALVSELRQVSLGKNRNGVKGFPTRDKLVKEAENLLKENPSLDYDLRDFIEGRSEDIPLSLLYQMQGFNGKPELVRNLKALRNREDLLKGSNGKPLILYRGSTKEFNEQFLGRGLQGNIHGAGRGIYGNGTYAASSQKGIYNENKARSTAQAYARMSRKREKTKAEVVAFGIKADANIREFENIGEFREWSSEVIQEARRKTGLKFQDVGQAAAAIGIHAYRIPVVDSWKGNSTADDYWVILNRGVVVASSRYI